MLEKIKKLHEIYKRERYFENIADVVNPNLGLAPSQINILKNFEPFTLGEIDFFGQRFRFSNAESFLHSFEEIFQEEVYKFYCDADEPYIIDCGSNIGLSLIYFKRLYPNSKILAFEPDKEIFQILNENISPYNTDKSILLNMKAVSNIDTTLHFFKEGGLAGSTMLDVGKKNNIQEVAAIDLKKHLNKTVDFLKIDIEGAENELIFNISHELKNVRNLFLEYHGLTNQSQNLGDILNLLKEAGFHYYIRVAGETMRYPFCEKVTSAFNQQLNIFCTRNV